MTDQVTVGSNQAEESPQSPQQFLRAVLDAHLGQEQRRNARLAVTEILAEAPTLAEAAPRLLRAVCEGLGWDFGTFWTVAADAGRLRCFDLWKKPSLQAEDFARETRQQSFAKGDGLPGRVWGSSQPAWVADVVRDTNFARAPVAAVDGLHGAFACPVVIHSEVLGVIEFFSHDIREPDADLLEMMATIGGQIGQFMERKRVEEHLRESEADLADFFENAAVGLHWVGPDGIIMRANQAELDLLGYSREEYVGRHIADFHADPGVIADILGRLQAGETLRGYEARLRCRDGSIKTVLIDSNVRQQGSRFFHTRCFTRDITDLKRAEALLTGEKRTLELIMQGAPLAQVLEFLTRTIEEISGGEMIPSILLLDREGTHLHHGAAPGLPPAYNQAIDGVAIGPAVGSCGTAAFCKEQVVVADIAADPLWQEFRELALGYGLRACWSTPIFSSDGQVLGTFALYYRQPRHPCPRDLQLIDLVTHTASIVIERKRAEEEKEKFVFLAENSSDFIGMCDMQYRPFFVNEAGLRLVGLEDLEAMRRTSIEEFFFPEDRAFVFETFFPKVLREGSGEVEIRFRHFTTGAAIWMIYNVLVLKDGRGEPVGIATISQNITGRKIDEERLRDADRRKDEFLAMLAHELRNPLAPVRNSVEILALRGNDPAAVEQAREVIDRQIRQMVRLVDDLLDVSRITRGKLTLKKEPADLAVVLAEAVETSRPLIESRHHRLTVTLDDEHLFLEADPTRLAQVLTNLLNNAAKYTEVGGRIEVSAGRQGGDLVVRVRDTGCGIAPDVLPHVFDLFAQEERTLARAQGGLGVGLTLVRRLVEMHGGTAEAFSPGRGRGSEFLIRLPALADLPAKVATAAHKAASLPAPASHRRILVVDDNADSAESMALLMTFSGHEVRVAHDGLAALEQAQALLPDLIFLDIGLPQLDGFEVAQRLRQQAALKNTILIAMTGYGQEEDRRRTREAGFHHHLVKPVDFDLLDALLVSSAPLAL